MLGDFVEDRDEEEDKRATSTERRRLQYHRIDRLVCVEEGSRPLLRNT